MRRRPLLRAAAVGGGAYMAGKSRARRQAEQEQAWSEQDARISDLENQQYQQPPPAPAQQAPPPPPAAAPAAGGISDQLKQLADLHSQGILTDDEFAAAKAKLLGT